mgnify:CR=1 FL=1
MKRTDRRAPLPASVPRPVKRASGRADALRTPAHVRVIGVELDEEDRALIRQKLGAKLGKFAASIERVTVRMTDANGPRGGVDHGDLLASGIQLGGSAGANATAAHDDDPHDVSASSSVSARRHHTGAVELRITYGTVRPASHWPPKRFL